MIWQSAFRGLSPAVTCVVSKRRVFGRTRPLHRAKPLVTQAIFTVSMGPSGFAPNDGDLP